MHSLPIQIQFFGHSMFPVLKNGDILFTQSIPIDKIKKGNIVCFLKENIYIAHRVIKIHRQKQQTILILKGDNLKQCDPALIIDDRYFHKVVAVLNKHRKLIRIDSRPWLARLSSHNLTYGIIRAEIGKVLKGMYGILKLTFGVFIRRNSQ